MNPFDFRGPEFLQFYAVLFLLCVGAALYLRHRMRLPSDAPDPLPNDPYEIAYVKGGAKSVILSVVAALTQSGHLKTVRDGSNVKISLDGKALTMTHRLEKWLHQEVSSSGSLSIEDLVWRFRSHDAELNESLVARGLYLRESDFMNVYVVPLLLALLPLGLGAIKVAIGISRDRPVAFLIFALVISFIIVSLTLITVPKRTRRGDQALELLEAQHPRTIDTNSSPDDVALMVGLYGSTILLGSPLNDLGRQIHPLSSGTDGGSSCGGGGGGGCGGGGCGGCGGGGD